MVKILIVDDDEDTREYILDVIDEYFDQGVYSVSEAKNGKEAEEIFQRELPDVVILDIFMPDTDGYELLSKLKEMSKGKTRLIVISGATVDPELLFKKGADDYYTKPFDHESFIESLKVKRS